MVAACGLMAAIFALGAPAGSAGRQIMIFNYGDEPIFWLSVGHAQTAQWSADVLPANDVIDVGQGKTVTIPLLDQCIYDLRAKYHDGEIAELDGVDLCAASSVRFDH